MKKFLEIVVKVKDAATSKLKKVQKSMGRLGKSTKTTSSNFKEFNRVMFSATAFVAMFEQALSRTFQAMESGAQLDRVSNQFSRVFGSPRGKLFNEISRFTDSFIDRMEAMRAGIALKTMGITSNLSQTAEVIARAGVAAKMAGLSSAEGIKHYTNFMRDGSVTHLNFLNLIAKTNIGLQTELSILKASTGIMGQVISTQRKLAIGRKLLLLATLGNMKGNRDLLDSVQSLSEAFRFLRDSIGGLLTQALVPIIDKISRAILKFSDFIDNLRRTDKNFVFFIKTTVLATAALTGFVAVLGTLRLTLLALSSLGFGLPKLLFLVGSLAAGFSIVTARTNGFLNKLKVMGAVLRGAWQLVHSFLSDPENFAKGIGLMDKKLSDFLRKRGLLELTKNIARVAAIIARTFSNAARTLGSGISWIADKVDFISSKIRNLFGMGGGSAWGRGGLNLGLGTLFAGVLGIGALKGGASMLGFGRRPKGTVTDPMYVKMSGFGGMGGTALGGAMGRGFLNVLLAGGALMGGRALGQAMGLDKKTEDFLKNNKAGKHVDGVLGMIGEQWYQHFNPTKVKISKPWENQSTMIDPSGGIPTSQAGRSDALFNMLKQLDSSERESRTQEIEAALKNIEQPGKPISDEEYKNIFNSMKESLVNIDRKSTEKAGSFNGPRRVVPGL